MQEGLGNLSATNETGFPLAQDCGHKCKSEVEGSQRRSR